MKDGGGDAEKDEPVGGLEIERGGECTRVMKKVCVCVSACFVHVCLCVCVEQASEGMKKKREMREEQVVRVEQEGRKEGEERKRGKKKGKEEIEGGRESQRDFIAIFFP